MPSLEDFLELFELELKKSFTLECLDSELILAVMNPKPPLFWPPLVPSPSSVGRKHQFDPDRRPLASLLCSLRWKQTLLSLQFEGPFYRDPQESLASSQTMLISCLTFESCLFPFPYFQTFWGHGPYPEVHRRFALIYHMRFMPSPYTRNVLFLQPLRLTVADFVLLGYLLPLPIPAFLQYALNEALSQFKEKVTLFWIHVDDVLVSQENNRMRLMKKLGVATTSISCSSNCWSKNCLHSRPTAPFEELAR